MPAVLGPKEPTRSYCPAPFGGALDEAASPVATAPNGLTKLTACTNLMYRRFGTWAKRPGSTQVYIANQLGPLPSTRPVSGIRWYAGFPTPITQTIVAAQQALFMGKDGGQLTRIANLTGQNGTYPVSFACANDPAAQNNNGADILIICGFTGPYGFGTGSYDIALANYASGNTATVKLTLGATTITVGPYTVLPTDNAQSIAAALAVLINDSLAVTGSAPFAGTSFVNGPNTTVLNFGAYASGSGGNSITFEILKNASILTGPTNFTGGGANVTAPLKWDGTTLSGLSYQIQQAFTGCVTWHDHVWYWGDPNNPDSLYASDIDEPEGFTFMNEEGPYKIGAGDGDPMVRAVVPVGNILYAFKTNNIYAITGYDFQSGEYQFAVEPAIVGSGVTRKENVAVLRNSLIYWDGSTFQRLVVGAFDTQDIGTAIPRTCGAIATGNQSLMRSAAGTFTAQSALNNSYFSVGPNTDSVLLTNVAMFACDVGNGVADTVLVYDEDASGFLQEDAWAPWTGWQVGAFFSFGKAEAATAGKFDQSTLLWAPPQTSGFVVSVNQFGSSATSDVGTTGIGNQAISFKAQTGWIDCSTPASLKELHRLLLDVEATAGAAITCSILAAGPVNGSAETIYPPLPVTFPTSLGNADEESAQILEQGVKPFLKGYKYMLQFTESSNTTAYEINGCLFDKIDAPFLS